MRFLLGTKFFSGVESHHLETATTGTMKHGVLFLVAMTLSSLTFGSIPSLLKDGCDESGGCVVVHSHGAMALRGTLPAGAVCSLAFNLRESFNAESDPKAHGRPEALTHLQIAFEMLTWAGQTEIEPMAASIMRTELERVFSTPVRWHDDSPSGTAIGYSKNGRATFQSTSSIRSWTNRDSLSIVREVYLKPHDRRIVHLQTLYINFDSSTSSVQTIRYTDSRRRKSLFGRLGPLTQDRVVDCVGPFSIRWPG